MFVVNVVSPSYGRCTGHVSVSSYQHHQLHAGKRLIRASYIFTQGRINQLGEHHSVFKRDRVSSRGILRAGSQLQVKVAIEKLILHLSLLKVQGDHLHWVKIFLCHYFFTSTNSNLTSESLRQKMTIFLSQSSVYHLATASHKSDTMVSTKHSIVEN